VKQTYLNLLETLGNELDILHRLDRKTIQSAGVPLLAEAIIRMRDNRISFSPGYDGLYGTVQLFTVRERECCWGKRAFFQHLKKMPKRPMLKKMEKRRFPAATWNARPLLSLETVEPIIKLNADQQKAVDHPNGHLMIVAGPGTGKTRTLTHKIARA
jgi:DNA helicase-2/ATP-dependent DNA helicase PcrA